jgi:hypothetical protein
MKKIFFCTTLMQEKENARLATSSSRVRYMINTINPFSEFFYCNRKNLLNSANPYKRDQSASLYKYNHNAFMTTYCSLPGGVV